MLIWVTLYLKKSINSLFNIISGCKKNTQKQIVMSKFRAYNAYVAKISNLALS